LLFIRAAAGRLRMRVSHARVMKELEIQEALDKENTERIVSETKFKTVALCGLARLIGRCSAVIWPAKQPLVDGERTGPQLISLAWS
jgi:hypothetical protein